MQGPIALTRDLVKLTEERPALLAMNDDVIGSGLVRVDRLLKEWFEKTWPVATRFEKADP